MTQLPQPDREIRDVAAQLADLQARLGDAYWNNDEVRELQDSLRTRIGSYAAWGPDKPPMHQRARRAALYEQEFARLLWPR